MKKKSNRFWLLLIGAVLLVSVAATIYIYTRPSEGTIAIVELDGEEVARFDLTAVKETATYQYTGRSGITNTVEVAPGKIRVCDTTCPDHICVAQGWLDAEETGILPIVCLPNSLIIQIQQPSSSGLDSLIR